MMFDKHERGSSIHANDRAIGATHAMVTLLEYIDFECPDSAVAAQLLEGLVADQRDRLRLIFRHFPRESVHPGALTVAEAAEAAAAQGHFWAMHDRLLTHQRELREDNLRTHAEAVGLDLQRFEDELSRHAHAAKVRRDMRQGIQDGVSATPALFINDWRYEGPLDRSSLLEAIAARVNGAYAESPSP